MAEKLFDFMTEAGRRGWGASHDLEPLSTSREGLIFTATGSDPYAYGPAVRFRESGARWLVIRLRAERAGAGQIYYFQGGPTEAQSVRFFVRGGRWETVRVALPEMSGEWRFRLDPPGGKTVVAALEIEPRVVLAEPRWPAPGGTLETGGRVVSGSVALELGKGVGALAIRFAGSRLALGHDGALLGWQESSTSAPVWDALAPLTRTELVVESRVGLQQTTAWTDSGGARWVFILTAQPQKNEALSLTMALSVDRPRVLLHFPALLLLASARTRRGLFAGVEYLDPPDTSSSQADLRGEQALRRVPAAHVPTLPLLAIQGEGRWLSLEWDPRGDAVPCFDSPARSLGAAGEDTHLLGLLFPPGERPPVGILPMAGQTLLPGSPLTARATLRAGRGEGVSPAIAAFLQSRPLPAVPKLPPGWEATLAAGWLDSRLHERGRWRHAWPGEFPPQEAADALACQSWLAARLAKTDPALAARLRRSADEGRRRVPPEDTGGIGHVRQSAAALLPGGELAKAARGAHAHARSLLARFAPDGQVLYAPSSGRADFSAGHFEKSANGLTAQPLLEALRALTLHPDGPLIAEAVGRLRQLESRWQDAAPRGAQTWEVPLHTPDILAAAHLVAASVLAHELTGERAHLDAARRWALAGASLVYLRDVAAPVGPYATIAVLGATNWEAPNWIGLPVQWCGLVLADAFFDLALHDERGPWKKIADGICASGMLQTWPRGEGQGREGLLPDSFDLPAQVRNDVCINPATLQVPLARSLGQPLYTRRALSFGGPFVHAPGVVVVRSARAFQVQPWPEGDYRVFLAGLGASPARLTLNKKPVEGNFDASTGGLTLNLRGPADVSWK